MTKSTKIRPLAWAIFYAFAAFLVLPFKPVHPFTGRLFNAIRRLCRASLREACPL